jgi:hypothetical protein
MGKKWTPAEDRKLATMRDEGKTFTQIAKAMGRSAPACQQRHVKNQSSVSETLTSQDVTLTTQPKPKPTWWSAMMWWRK